MVKDVNQEVIHRAHRELRNLSRLQRPLWESGNLWIVIDLLRPTASAFIRLDGHWGRDLKEKFLRRVESLFDVVPSEVPCIGKDAHIKVDINGYVHLWSDAQRPQARGEELRPAG